MSPTDAKTTTVTVESSRAEIERTLTRYGALSPRPIEQSP